MLCQKGGVPSTRLQILLELPQLDEARRCVEGRHPIVITELGVVVRPLVRAATCRSGLDQRLTVMADATHPLR